MSKWPTAYAMGPQKMGKVEEVDPEELRKRFLELDYSSLERRILANMTEKERKQALAAAYGAGEVKQGIVAGEYPPPDVLRKLEEIGVGGGTVTGRVTRSEASFKEVPKAWKPSPGDEEPPF